MIYLPAMETKPSRSHLPLFVQLTISLWLLLIGVGAWSLELPPPVANAGTLDVQENCAKNGTLTGICPDGMLNFSLTGTPAVKGKVEITDSSTGNYTYTPNKDATGDDAFQFIVSNSSGVASNTATISVCINQSISVPYPAVFPVAPQLARIILPDNPVPDPYGLSFSFNANPPIYGLAPQDTNTTVSLTLTSGAYLVYIYNDTLDPLRTTPIGTCYFSDGGPYTDNGVPIDWPGGTWKYTFTAVLCDDLGNPVGEECSANAYYVYLSFTQGPNNDEGPAYIGLGDQVDDIVVVHIEPTAIIADFTVKLNRDSTVFDATTIHQGEGYPPTIHPNLSSIPLLFRDNGNNSLQLTTSMDQTKDWLGAPDSACFDLFTWPVGMSTGTGNFTLTFTAGSVNEYSQSIPIHLGSIVIQPTNWVSNKISSTNNGVSFYATGLRPYTNYQVTPMISNIPIFADPTFYRISGCSPYTTSSEFPYRILSDISGNWGDSTHLGMCIFDSTAMQSDGFTGNFTLQLSNPNSTINSNAIANTTIYNKAYVLANNLLTGAMQEPDFVYQELSYINYSINQITNSNKTSIMSNLSTYSAFFFATHGDIDAIAPHGTQKFADCNSNNSAGNWITFTDVANQISLKSASSIPPYSIVELSCCFSAGKWNRQWYDDEVNNFDDGPLVLAYDNSKGKWQRDPIYVDDLANSFGAYGDYNRAYIGFVDPVGDDSVVAWDSKVWQLLNAGYTVQRAVDQANIDDTLPTDDYGLIYQPKVFGDASTRIHSVYQ